MASYTLFVEDSGRAFYWKDCEVAGCPNQVCLGRSDRFCYPHGPSDQTLAELIANPLQERPEEPQPTNPVHGSNRHS